ncbi:MAG: hypothetical protein QOK28_1899 [Actinomycetota bacterium]
MRAAARVLLWQFWERVVRRPLKIEYCGLLLVCHPHENASSAVLYARLPEYEEMSFVLRFLRRGDTFVDVGANVGTYTLLAASVEGTRVIAYEPTTSAFSRLRENITVNNLGPRVTARQAAVGATSGEASVTTDLGTMNRITEDGSGERVPLVALDTDASVGRVTLLKIDVEGAEVEVLRGAEQLIERDSPALIIEANSPGALSDWLTTRGYSFCRYDPVTNELTASAIGQGANVISIRDVAGASLRLKSDR